MKKKGTKVKYHSQGEEKEGRLNSGTIISSNPNEEPFMYIIQEKGTVLYDIVFKEDIISWEKI